MKSTLIPFRVVFAKIIDESGDGYGLTCRARILKFLQIYEEIELSEEPKSNWTLPIITRYSRIM